MIKRLYDVFQQEEACNILKNDSDYIEVDKEYIKAMNNLNTTLDHNQNKLLNELRDSISNLLDCESRIYFTSGFKKGANFIMEIKEGD